MGRLLIGTTSWTEKTLIQTNRFYPPDCKSAESRLRFYAGQFPIVEVDSSYYAIPPIRNAQLWVERTPEGFLFDVKAYRFFTQHQTPLASLPADIRQRLDFGGRRNLYQKDVPSEIRQELWSRFLEAIEPLRRSGKLGVILLQFPPWFVFNRRNFRYLDRCREILERYSVALEFRNRSWFTDHCSLEVIQYLGQRGFVHVVVDEPQGFASSIPALWEVTSPQISMVRFHGRNRAMWEKKHLASSAERFNYLYSSGELAEFVEPVRHLAKEAGEVHVLFNNCYQDHAQNNATLLARLLDCG